MQLKAGQSIEQILKPYVPEYTQFTALLSAYHALGNDKGTSTELLHKIRLNIERVKLMKSGLGSNYALVNIPEFKVRVIENNKTSIDMRIVVGKRDKQTPVFSAELQSIVLNPTWNVPDSIARHEIIPKTLKDPAYLKKHRLVMRKDYNLNSPALSFNAQNAAAYVGGKGEVPFKFIEVASGRNALGRVKFLFPNENSVYMHDTPAKHLFKRKVRTYSHGCVRLGNPMKMLDFLATNYSTATAEKVNEEYKSKKTHYIPIVKRLPVHTAYLTSYVAEDGKLHLFHDIYNYDKLQKLNFR
jgi:murein L,D-transpeptidase YcbB/YkuD